ncbi:MAG: tRNA pseudouridine(54/55) synthase Pus10 [Candidatus Hermodarchaeota archaeon]
MHILDKILEIYQKYSICTYCLGRMFGLLGTNTTNYERGYSLLLTLVISSHKNYLSENKKNREKAIQTLKLLAENSKFIPAQKVLEKEGIEYSKSILNKPCYLCHDIFLNLHKYVEKADETSKNLEFTTFLCGTSSDSQLINREDIFKAEYKLLESESFKTHFNREVGKLLSNKLNKKPDFENPDVLFIFSLDYDHFKIELMIRSLFIRGRYNKFLRGIPQTKWYCRTCQGKGCEKCNFTGKQYEISIEELISPIFVLESKSSSSKFHGAGREDIDVRMLGNGRPFIIELKNPAIRSLDLYRITIKINEQNLDKVKISNLKYSNKQEVIKLKEDAENTKKTYCALVESNIESNINEFNNKLKIIKNRLENNTISQKTPNRVLHRRSDLIREKMVYNINGTFINTISFKFIIEAQGGTYIKELISGDNGRTSPSISELFGNDLICKELDVIDINY